MRRMNATIPRCRQPSRQRVALIAGLERSFCVASDEALDAILLGIFAQPRRNARLVAAARATGETVLRGDAELLEELLRIRTQRHEVDLRLPVGLGQRNDLMGSMLHLLGDGVVPFRS